MRRFSTFAPARPIWPWPTGGRRKARYHRGHGFLRADVGNRPRKMPPCGRRLESPRFSFPRSAWERRGGRSASIRRADAEHRALRSQTEFGNERERYIGGIQQGIVLLEADTLHLPFPDATFQIVSVAFGLRNLSDTDAGLREMARVCRPGGRVAILEFSTPTAWPLGALYGWYFQNVLPGSARPWHETPRPLTITSRGASADFPRAKSLADRMRAAGLGKSGSNGLRSEWRRCMWGLGAKIAARATICFPQF